MNAYVRGSNPDAYPPICVTKERAGFDAWFPKILKLDLRGCYGAGRQVPARGAAEGAVNRT